MQKQHSKPNSCLRNAISDYPLWGQILKWVFNGEGVHVSGQINCLVITAIVTSSYISDFQYGTQIVRVPWVAENEQYY